MLLVLVVVVLGSMVWELLVTTTKAPETKTDIAQYERLLGMWRGSGLVDHFPDQVPASASASWFSYNSGYRYGGAHIQLRVKLPPEQVRQVLSRYEPVAKHRYLGGDRAVHRRQPGGVPTTFFRTNGSQEMSFPDTYVLLVLGAQHSEDDSSSWERGETFGVAVGLAASEVIYWAESW